MRVLIEMRIIIITIIAIIIITTRAENTWNGMPIILNVLRVNIHSVVFMRLTL